MNRTERRKQNRASRHSHGQVHLTAIGSAIHEQRDIPVSDQNRLLVEVAAKADGASPQHFVELVEQILRAYEGRPLSDAIEAVRSGAIKFDHVSGSGPQPLPKPLHLELVPDAEIWVPMKQLADEAGMTPREIRRSLCEMSKLGYVIFEEHGGLLHVIPTMPSEELPG
jgi:hypothetical protein